MVITTEEVLIYVYRREKKMEKVPRRTNISDMLVKDQEENQSGDTSAFL